eukprot:15440969-Alexandrium_andersonii.AAC.1
MVSPLRPRAPIPNLMHMPDVALKRSQGRGAAVDGMADHSDAAHEVLIAIAVGECGVVFLACYVKHLVC